jgi:hypothetical protein
LWAATEDISLAFEEGREVIQDEVIVNNNPASKAAIQYNDTIADERNGEEKPK